MRILSDWDIHLSYAAALRAEMVSMLAKYVPGGVWTPAARVVAARRAGVTDGALVTASMLLEAGVSGGAGGFEKYSSCSRGGRGRTAGWPAMSLRGWPRE